MNFIWNKLTEWLKELLIGGIMENLTGIFDGINGKVAEIAGTVGTTPQGWNASVYNMIKNLSDSVIVPIAGIVLTAVMCYELIHMVIDRNSMHDFETFFFFKWIIKAFIAIMIVSHTWDIIMGVFDLAQNVVNRAAGVIVADTSLDLTSIVTNLEGRLQEMEIGPLFGLWFQSMLIGLISWILTICIFIVVFGRMIEIYLVTSVAPIPLATMANREWGHMGQNYLRALFALGFQAFLIVVCVAIYAVLIRNIAMSGVSPAAALQTLNTQICARNQEEMFVTVWLGVLEISTGMLIAANAGHEYPVLKKANGRFEVVKDRHGFVIGGMEGMRYREYTLQLTPGSKLFVYTDGLTEATNAHEELLGMDRMVAALQSCEDGNPREIIQGMDRAVRQFVGAAPQFDDLTMLCLEYRGPQKT